MHLAYYNEFDPKAAAWLRELIKAGLIAPGFVDERSIVDVNPYELTQYTQHHFFAGIGGWSYALRLAGWADGKPVVTASCPCQPFSAAGKRGGTTDARHLWPVFFNILAHLKSSTVFGEQVASADGREWLAGVRIDLEGLGYEVGAADLCAAGVGSPHIRQRIYWLANRMQLGRKARARPKEKRAKLYGIGLVARGEPIGLGDADGAGSFSRIGTTEANGHGSPALANGGACGLEHAEGNRRIERRTESGQRGSFGGCWDVFDVVHCTDGKARRFEPGSFPLAHGLSHRVGLLRGYGNAIVPELAALFIQESGKII